MTNKKVILFAGLSEKTITWSPAMEDRFGVFPATQVYLSRPGTDVYDKTAVQPTIDAPVPGFITMTFNFGGPVSGFIAIM